MRTPTRRRRGAAGDLVLLAIVGVLLLGALAAAGATLYRVFYSPTAFVERYLDMLADGRTGDALAVAGVAVESSQLAESGLPAAASDALLRSAALRPLTDVTVVSETDESDATVVTALYTAGEYPGSTAFRVERAGWMGLVPTWRFARSPLAVIELDVTGSRTFSVNGFELDERQVLPEGVGADQPSRIPLLVFSPGAYTVAVDTPLVATTGVAVLADVPLSSTQVDVRAEPTAAFSEVVQNEVDDYLDACADQRVLQPTGCPFGFVVQNRIDGEPVWTIVGRPPVTLEPDGDDWRIPPVPGDARISVSIRSLFDGSVRSVEEDVAFTISGTVAVQPDGSAAIILSDGN